MFISERTIKRFQAAAHIMQSDDTEWLGRRHRGILPVRKHLIQWLTIGEWSNVVDKGVQADELLLFATGKTSKQDRNTLLTAISRMPDYPGPDLAPVRILIERFHQALSGDRNTLPLTIHEMFEAHGLMWVKGKKAVWQ